MRSHADYSVGWVAALPLEMAAARAMLDETHPNLPQPATDRNEYILGRVFGHNVVIACLPAGLYGTVSAAVVLSHMLSTFSNLQFGLMVGIGGGVPSISCDMRLGDVVVSQPTGKYGGVVQYDFGRVLAGGEFQHNHVLNQPPQALLTSISLLKADQLGERNYSLSKVVEDRADAMADPSGIFKHPGQKNDLLFNAHYNHKEREDETCKRCDKQQAVHRDIRPSNDPRVHYGLIASADKVMKDSKVRDELARKFGILCFEMEAAGLMNQLPCLVIRGICDYSDSHKNKRWQGYAALTAAAYARLLLSVVSVRRIQSRSADDLTFEETQCMKCLFVTDAAEDRSSLKRRKGVRVTGTSDWIIETDELKKWLAGEYNILWLHGYPGTGKSTVAVAMTEQLPKQPSFLREEKLLAYFFCDSISESRRTCTSILRTLLYQIIQQRPMLMKQLLSKYAIRGEDLFSSFDALWSLLMTVSEDAGSEIYCIIDALDECDLESQLMLLSEIRDTFQGLQCAKYKIHFLITSRPYPEIGRELSGFQNRDLGFYAEIRSDLKRFIELKVQELANRNHYPTRVSNEVSEILEEKAEGTFLWAGLACGELTSVRSRDAVRKLRSFPLGLRRLYQNLLDNALSHHGGDNQTVMDILAFVAVAQRPVMLSDLIDACQLYEDNTDEERLAYTIDDIELCQLLVIIQDSNVRLLHQSVKDFLLGRNDEYPINDLEAHAKIANSCIDHILQGCLDNHTNQGQSTFIDYAVLFWPEHACLAAHKFEILESYCSFFEVGSNQQAQWLKMYKNIKIYSKIPEGFTSPHVAARWGILPLARFIMQNCKIYRDAEFEGSNGLTPLKEAVISGQVEVFSFFLKQTDPSIMIDLEVLIAAASNQRNGDKLMVELSALAGGRFQVRDDLIETAVRNKHRGKELMAVLLKHSPDIPITEDILIAAAENEGVGKDVMILLLNSGRKHAEVTEDVVLAAVSNKIRGKEILETLLELRENTPVTDEVVEAAARNRHSGKEIISLLLDRFPGQIEITGEVLVAAAQNEEAGKDIVSQLLGVKVSEELVESISIEHNEELIRSLSKLRKAPENNHTEPIKDTEVTIPDTRGDTINPVLQHKRVDDIAAQPTAGLMYNLRDYTEPVAELFLPPSFDLLISRSIDDYEIRIWDPLSGDSKHTLNFCNAVTIIGPDFKSVAYAEGDNKLNLQLPGKTSKDRRMVFVGHSDHITSIAFAADGKCIATGSEDTTVRLWRPPAASAQHVLLGHSQPISALAFSAFDGLIASGSLDETVRVWDSSLGYCLTTLYNHVGGVTALAFAPDNKRIASSASDKLIRLWDPRTYSLICVLDSHEGPSTTLAFSPDSTMLASAGRGARVKLWNTRTRSLQRDLTDHNEQVHTVTFSSDGKALAAASRSKGVRVWDIRNGYSPTSIGAGSPYIDTIAFSPDGSTIASASKNQSFSLWDIHHGIKVSERYQLVRWPQTHIAISPCGGKLATVAWVRPVRIWSTRTGRLIQSLGGDTNNAKVPLFSPDGSMLAFVLADNRISVWESPTNVRVLGGLDMAQTVRLVFSPNGRLLASSRDDGIELWDPIRGTLLWREKLSLFNVSLLAFAPNGRALATREADSFNGIVVRDISNPYALSVISHIRTGFWGVQKMVFSLDSNLIITVSAIDNIRLWDSATGDLVGTLESNCHLDGNIELAPLTGVLASLTVDGTIILWSLELKRSVQVIKCDSRLRAPFVFSIDGKTLASSRESGGISIWREHDGTWIQALGKGVEPTQF